LRPCASESSGSSASGAASGSIRGGGGGSSSSLGRHGSSAASTHVATTALPSIPETDPPTGAVAGVSAPGQQLQQCNVGTSTCSSSDSRPLMNTANWPVVQLTQQHWGEQGTDLGVLGLEAKVSDFGLSWCLDSTDTHVSSCHAVSALAVGVPQVQKNLNRLGCSMDYQFGVLLQLFLNALSSMNLSC
jgi:hypothetical protein